MTKKAKGYGGPWWNDRGGWFIKPRVLGPDGEALEGLPRQKYAPPSIGKRDREAAIRWADEYIRTIQRSGRIPTQAVAVPKSKPLTAANFAEAWIQIRKDQIEKGEIKPGTLASNKAMLTNHILTHDIAEVPFPDLTPARLVEWVEDLKKKRKSYDGQPYAAYEVINIFMCLSGMVTTAIERELVPEWAELTAKNIDIKNPLTSKIAKRALPIAAPKAGRGVKVCMLRPAAEDFLSTFPRDIPLIRLVWYRVAVLTGLRVGELFGAQWGDIKSQDGMLYFSIERQCAQFAKEGYARLDTLKTHAGRRAIPMHSLLHSVLKMWREDGWRAWVGRKPTASDAIFPNADGEHFRPKAAELLRSDLGMMTLPTHALGHPLEMRSFRRTFTTLLKEFGVEKDTRKELQGHELAKDVLDRHYTAEVIRPLYDAVQKIKLEIPPEITPGVTPIRRKKVPVPEAIAWAMFSNEDEDLEDDEVIADLPVDVPRKRGREKRRESIERSRREAASRAEERTSSPLAALDPADPETLRAVAAWLLEHTPSGAARPVARERPPPSRRVRRRG